MNEPTRWRHGNTPSLLDLVFTKYHSDVECVKLLAPLGKSDHAVLSVTLGMKTVNVPDKYKRVFAKIPTDKLRAKAAEVDWNRISELSDVETQWTAIRQHLQRITEEVVPLQKMRRRGLPPWWCGRASRATTDETHRMEETASNRWTPKVPSVQGSTEKSLASPKGVSTTIRGEARSYRQAKSQGVI